MDFKSSTVTFDTKSKFTSDMKRFACDEAARYTADSNEAASASMDEFAEKGMRFSAEKSKGKVKEYRRILDVIKQEKKELLADDIESIHPSFDLDADTGSSHSPKEETKNRSDSSKGEDKKAEKGKELEAKEKDAKAGKSKETKKAASKTAVASMLMAKKELSNGLASDKSTGDAMRDGNTGLMRVFTEYINPMHYVKMLCAKIGAIIMPYILGFMAIASVVLIIVAFLFSVLQPLAEIGEALSNFMSFFSGGDSTFINTTLSEEEINSIIADSGADETQEIVIRYALSKVGYPYSQENRASGSAYDCSSLAYYSWDAAGVDISYGSGYPPSAAEGARMLKNDGKALDTMDLKPGDLIYYGGSANGRYMGIYHVAIYAGDGKAVEALNERYGVVYQDLRTENAIMVVRPNK